ncbi:uncharacterized protein A4U43_C02F2080 [Asparagus officinalis]|uniref:Uncharacterized protein n=1 Tax=Asparagus officinalis TaxID=4686 RepID=A0A5P1FK97_ASPOF|nr:uncharacterized protein A4U43_C02F2080 [Asparagus officinalis]
MAKEGHCYVDDQDEEEGYIDMDINPATCYTCCTAEEFEFQMSSRDPPEEFEFQMFQRPQADHSHLPRRRDILQGQAPPPPPPPSPARWSRPSSSKRSPTTRRRRPPAAPPPSPSCNVSPATSCYVSGELSRGLLLRGGGERRRGRVPREPARAPARAAGVEEVVAKKLRIQIIADCTIVYADGTSRHRNNVRDLRAVGLLAFTSYMCSDLLLSNAWPKAKYPYKLKICPLSPSRLRFSLAPASQHKS